MPKAPSRATKPAASPEPDAEAPKAPKPPRAPRRAAKPAVESQGRPGRHGCRLRGRLVAARHRLPDLPAQLRRQRRRRHRRPARDHRPPRPPRAGRTRRGRDLAVADLPVAGPRPRLRRQRPRRRSIRCSAPRPTSTAGRRGAPPRHPGRPRPGHEPHERPAPLVRGLAARPGRGRTPTGTCGATRRARTARTRRCRRTTGCRSSGTGLGVGPRRGQFYYHTFLVEQPELNWRARGRGGPVRRWSAAGSSAASTASGSTSSTPSSSIRPAVQPGRAGRRLGPPGPRVRPRPARLPGAHRAVPGDPGRAPGRMSVGELFDGTVERGGRADAARHLVFDWGLVEAALDGEGDHARCRARAAFGATAGRPPCCRTTTSRATLAPGRPGADADDHDAVARAAAVLLLTLRGTPFLYYGEELGLRDVDIPPDGERRPAGERGSPPRFDWWDRVRAGRRCRGRGGPGPGSRPVAVAALGARRGDAQRRRPRPPTRRRCCRTIAG